MASLATSSYGASTAGSTSSAPVQRYSPSKHTSVAHYERMLADRDSVPSSRRLAFNDSGNSEHTKVVTNAAATRWTGLDMANMTIRNLSASLFKFAFLTTLRLNNNQLVIVPPAIGQLKALTALDLSANRIRHLPPEIGMCTQLRELLLHNNALVTLPWETGMLYQLDALTLEGNQWQDPIASLKETSTQHIVQYLRDNGPMPQQPPDRPWVPLTENVNESAAFTVFCMNTLCDKYASPQMYGYCPSWALAWDNRKQLILTELLSNGTDIICLQEVETGQFYDFFLPELTHNGYNGIFRPKSRAKTMGEEETRSVDGCAIFYKTSKFSAKTDMLIEFQQAHCRPELRSYADFFNRIMPKDNIALVVALRHTATKETLIVANPHMTWDPQYADVKLVQTVLLMDELQRTVARGVFGSREALPMIICGDFNSLPSSPVYQFLSKGQLAKSAHNDFDGHNYGPYTEEDLTHRFQLSSAYAKLGELPFTNKTPSFVGTIDYIWYSNDRLAVTGVLGPLSSEYSAKHPGFPNAHFPSDHICLVAEMMFT